jgi:hypothetical protein
MKQLDRITMDPAVLGGETLYQGYASDRRDNSGLDSSGKGD